jgi:hypothetical protein
VYAELTAGRPAFIVATNAYSGNASRISIKMARPKLDKTLADYMAIAITPALIMLLTGSLVWFLAELGYTGGRPERIRWILFWFVIAAVLVARIAIENGRAYASMYLLGLAGATSLTIFKFAGDGPVVPIICLGIVAWCADKLTWDCTLIDESEDASGEGLLQVAGVADEAELPGGDADPASATSSDSASADAGSAADRKGDEEKIPFWKRLFVNESERAGRPHAPGLWVVYFSLAALPLYGFGQVWIPVERADSRYFAFQCLLVYVGAALGLLLMTSFLGLRRYLRQRNLEMLGAMAATWVVMGSAIAIGILVVALLLPRPQGDYSLAEAIDYASEELQEASDWAFPDDDGGKGEGQQSGPADPEAEDGSATDPEQQGQPDGDQPAQNDQQNAKDGDGGEQKGEDGKQSGGEQGEGKDGKQEGDEPGDGKQEGDEPGDGKDDKQGDDKQGDDKQGDDEQGDDEQGDDEQLANDDAEQPPDEAGEENAGEEEAAEAEQAESTPPESDSSWMDSLAENVGALFKWLIYGAVACAVLYMAYRNWPAVVSFFRNLWAELLGIFGRKPAHAVADDKAAEEAVASARPFSAFRDPFRSGSAASSSPGELVRYTFEALQAWAFENNCGRTPDQTPMEFGQRLQSRQLKISNEAHEVSLLYAQVAYGGFRPDDSSVATLQKLWRKLT